MKIYHYHPVTGEYLSEADADESPLEPGVYLVPAHATTEQPPSALTSETVIWDGHSWNLIALPEPSISEVPTPEPLVEEPVEPGVYTPPVLPTLSDENLTTRDRLLRYGFNPDELREYLLSEIAPPLPDPSLTTEQKLEAAGLTVAELKELFGL
jgi:hypothetical protein